MFLIKNILCGDEERRLEERSSHKERPFGRLFADRFINPLRADRAIYTAFNDRVILILEARVR